MPAPPIPGSFRVPNSIMQGLTTTTAEDLNTLSVFEMVILLGVISLVNTKDPKYEVRTTPGQLLEVMEVSHLVAHEVESELQTESGLTRRKRYRTRRYSPSHAEKIHTGLNTLFERSVVILRNDPQTGRRLEERHVHILDSFAYDYRREGVMVDLDQLANDKKVNVGSAGRPVWRIPCTRHSAIIIKFNSELMKELTAQKGTIGFTLLARKIFSVFREFKGKSSAIRLILLILRQREKRFFRSLSQAFLDLGYDVTHPARATQDLQATLNRLQEMAIVVKFYLDMEHDRMEIATNQNWYKDEADAVYHPAS